MFGEKFYCMDLMFWGELVDIMFFNEDVLKLKFELFLMRNMISICIKCI